MTNPNIGQLNEHKPKAVVDFEDSLNKLHEELKKEPRQIDGVQEAFYKLQENLNVLMEEGCGVDYAIIAGFPEENDDFLRTGTQSDVIKSEARFVNRFSYYIQSCFFDGIEEGNIDVNLIDKNRLLFLALNNCYQQHLNEPEKRRFWDLALKVTIGVTSIKRLISNDAFFSVLKGFDNSDMCSSGVHDFKFLKQNGCPLAWNKLLTNVTVGYVEKKKTVSSDDAEQIYILNKNEYSKNVKYAKDHQILDERKRSSYISFLDEKYPAEVFEKVKEGDTQIVIEKKYYDRSLVFLSNKKDAENKEFYKTDAGEFEKYFAIEKITQKSDVKVDHSVKAAALQSLAENISKINWSLIIKRLRTFDREIDEQLEIILRNRDIPQSTTPKEGRYWRFLQQVAEKMNNREFCKNLPVSIRNQAMQKILKTCAKELEHNENIKIEDTDIYKNLLHLNGIYDINDLNLVSDSSLFVGKLDLSEKEFENFCARLKDKDKTLKGLRIRVNAIISSNGTASSIKQDEEEICADEQSLIELLKVAIQQLDNLDQLVDISKELDFSSSFGNISSNMQTLGDFIKSIEFGELPIGVCDSIKKKILGHYANSITLEDFIGDERKQVINDRIKKLDRIIKIVPDLSEDEINNLVEDILNDEGFDEVIKEKFKEKYSDLPNDDITFENCLEIRTLPDPFKGQDARQVKTDVLIEISKLLNKDACEKILKLTDPKIGDELTADPILNYYINVILQNRTGNGEIAVGRYWRFLRQVAEKWGDAKFLPNFKDEGDRKNAFETIIQNGAKKLKDNKDFDIADISLDLPSSGSKVSSDKDLKLKKDSVGILSNITENPEERNPYAQKADITSHNKVLRWMKLINKVRNKSTLYHEIIPETDEHGSWTLGAQLPVSEYKKFNKSNDCVRVSLLADIESEDTTNENVHRIKMFDHGNFRVETGKLMHLSEMHKHFESIQDDMIAKEHSNKKNIYCHCMAGKGRSSFTTTLYLHKNSDKMFDWLQDKECKEIIIEQCKRVAEKNGIDANHVDELFERLAQKNPSIEDIAEFVHLRRPGVKPLDEMGGCQGYLIGIAALEDFSKKCIIGSKELDENKLKACRFVADVPAYSFFYDQENSGNESQQSLYSFDSVVKKFNDLNKGQEENILDKIFGEYINDDKSFINNNPARLLRIANLYCKIEDNPKSRCKLQVINKAKEFLLSTDRKQLNKIPVGEIFALLNEGDMQRVLGTNDLQNNEVFFNYLDERINNSKANYDKLDNDNLKKDFINLAGKYKVEKHTPKRKIDLANIILDNALDKLVSDKTAREDVLNFVVQQEINTSKIDKIDKIDIDYTIVGNSDKVKEIDEGCREALYDLIKTNFGECKKLMEVNDQDFQLEKYDENKFNEFLQKNPVWEQALTVVKYRVLCKQTQQMEGVNLEEFKKQLDFEIDPRIKIHLGDFSQRRSSLTNSKYIEEHTGQYHGDKHHRYFIDSSKLQNSKNELPIVYCSTRRGYRGKYFRSLNTEVLKREFKKGETVIYNNVCSSDRREVEIEALKKGIYCEFSQGGESPKESPLSSAMRQMYNELTKSGDQKKGCDAGLWFKHLILQNAKDGKVKINSGMKSNIKKLFGEIIENKENVKNELMDVYGDLKREIEEKELDKLMEVAFESAGFKKDDFKKAKIDDKNLKGPTMTRKLENDQQNDVSMSSMPPK